MSRDTRAGYARAHAARPRTRAEVAAEVSLLRQNLRQYAEQHAKQVAWVPGVVEAPEHAAYLAAVAEAETAIAAYERDGGDGVAAHEAAGRVQWRVLDVGGAAGRMQQAARARRAS